MRRIGFVLAAGAAMVAFLAPPADAKAPWVKKAHEAGHKDLVKNCASCHAKAMPKKDDWKLNELGDWLEAQKKAKGAKEIDLAWLKDYKPAAGK
jgi:hypothetical protein